MAATKPQATYQASGRQKVRVFLEGREVPVSSVAVTSGIGNAKSAQIQLVPLSIIKFIRPRTQVHVFVRDSLTFGDSNFYLCFEGEVVGRAMSKQHNGRAVTILAMDYSGYMDDVKAFIMNPNFLAGKATSGVLSGEPSPYASAKAEATKVINTMSNQSSLMVTYLTRYKDKEGNPDLVRGCMEIARQLSSTNEFYRAAYERLRILDRMFIKSSGRMGRLLSGIRIEEYLSSYTGAIGGTATLKQMIMDIMELIFHSFVSVPFPSMVKVSRGDSKQTGYSLAEFLFIPDTYLLPPPRCNVIFPSQQIGFEYSDDFRAAPTRMAFRYTFPLTSNNETTMQSYPVKYYPTPFADYMYGSKNKGNRKSTTTELNSGFGPSKLITSKGGQTYAQIFYGDKSSSGGKQKSVGPAYMPTLRESDYLSNEESVKGIYFATESLSPNYTAMVRGGGTTSSGTTDAVKKSTSRDEMMNEIGKYLFYKKRYGARQVSATIMFNPFLVPGFTALFLDDSQAGQSFVAKLQGVTQNLTNEGFMTSVSLAYARDFDEIDLMTGSAGDPPLPSWFDPDDFGFVDTTKKFYNLETSYLGPATKDAGRGGGLGIITEADVKARSSVQNPTVYTQLSNFYLATLGCSSITNIGSAPKDKKSTREALVTTEGATLYLINQYKNKPDQFARDAFVRSYIQRPVATMEQAFAFIGAEAVPYQSNGKNIIPTEFAVFKAITDAKRTGLPGRFDGSGFSDENVLKLRRDVIDKYVKQLKERRGFRG